MAMGDPGAAASDSAAAAAASSSSSPSSLILPPPPVQCQSCQMVFSDRLLIRHHLTKSQQCWRTVHTLPPVTLALVHSGSASSSASASVSAHSPLSGPAMASPPDSDASSTIDLYQSSSPVSPSTSSSTVTATTKASTVQVLQHTSDQAATKGSSPSPSHPTPYTPTRVQQTPAVPAPAPAKHTLLSDIALRLQESTGSILQHSQHLHYPPGFQPAVPSNGARLGASFAFSAPLPPPPGLQPTPSPHHPYTPQDARPTHFPTPQSGFTFESPIRFDSSSPSYVPTSPARFSPEAFPAYSSSTSPSNNTHLHSPPPGIRSAQQSSPFLHRTTTVQTPSLPSQTSPRGQLGQRSLHQPAFTLSHKATPWSPSSPPGPQEALYTSAVPAGRRSPSPTRQADRSRQATDVARENGQRPYQAQAGLAGVGQGNGAQRLEQHQQNSLEAQAVGEDGYDSDKSAASILIRQVSSRLKRKPAEGSEAARDDRTRLQDALYELNRRHRPSPYILAERKRMVADIRRKLDGMLDAWRYDFRYQLVAFGSTAYGLDTDSSDVDLCIIDPKRPDGFRSAADLYDLGDDPKKRQRLDLDPIYDVRRVAGALRRLGYPDVRPIPGAAVPIVKFTTREGIRADINANEQLGSRNSALLAAYVSYDPIIRPFLVFLKVWAKQRKINDSAGETGAITLSSYSLVLMAIGYMQQIGLVPNLQDVRLIKELDVKRQAFWTKIVDKNAIKPGLRHRGGRNYGDFKALAVDTTFIRRYPKQTTAMDSQADPAWLTELRRWKATHQGTAGQAPEQPPLGESPKTTGATDSRHDSVSPPLPLLELLEGFFRYYVNFSIHTTAVSIWRGEPMKRKIGYQPPACDKDGSSLPRLPHITREEREELFEEESEADESATENGDGSVVSSARSSNETDPDEVERREVEAQAAGMARIEALLRAEGIEELGLSFEEKLKLHKEVEEKNGKEAVETYPRQSEIDEGNAGNAPAFISATELAPQAECTTEREDEPSVIKQVETQNKRHAAEKRTDGLTLDDAVGPDYMFPFPEMEDPETFEEPSHWNQRLVVQDPFIHTRNTCMNVQPATVQRIMEEFKRALSLIEHGAPIEEICSNADKEKVQMGLSEHEQRRADRAVQRKLEEKLRREKQKAAKAARIQSQFQRENLRTLVAMRHESTALIRDTR